MGVALVKCWPNLALWQWPHHSWDENLFSFLPLPGFIPSIVVMFLIFYHFQAGLADCGAILEKKGVDGLVMQNIPKDTKIPTCDLLLDGNVKKSNQIYSGWFQIWNHLKCLQALLGMTDSVLQMWSREMKIMQIKWGKKQFFLYNISPYADQVRKK